MKFFFTTLFLTFFCLFAFTQITYTVKKGDTVYNLAKKNNVSVEMIYDLNPSLKTTGLKLGQNILIPNTTTAAKKTKNESGTYTVVGGDTIYSLAKNNDLKTEELLMLNPGLTPENLKEGQVINVKKTKKTKKTTSSSTASESIKNEIPITTKPTSLNYTTHIVKKGETLYTITQQYEITEETFLKENPKVKNTGLKEGMVVYIPKITSPVQIKTKEEVINIAMLLPFNAKNPYENVKRTEIATNFYKGTLLALDSLQKEGYKLKVSVFDNEGTPEKTKAILAEKNLGAFDLILGPLRSDNVHLVADQLKGKKTLIVSPFSDGLELIGHSNILDLTLGKDALYQALFQNIDTNKSSENIYVIDNNHSDLLSVLKTKYPNSRIMDITAISEYDLATLRSNSTIILNTADEKKAYETLSEFNKVMTLSNNYKANFVALGYNKVYIKSKKPSSLFIGNEILHNMKLSVLLENYTDEFSYSNIKTRNKYKTLNNTFPDTSAVMGFDATYALIKDMNYLKPEKMNEQEIYNTLKFVKIPNGGYKNMGICIIKY